MPTPGYRLAVPVIGTSDVLAAVAYFERTLGFTQEFLWGDPPVYAGVKAGGAEIYICHDPDFATAVQRQNLAPDLFLWVNGINELYRRHQENGAQIEESLTKRPWGALQYTVREPNGFRLKFAEALDED
jgi:uncharacterized glyoxalase superfamily protein PhnB